MNIKLYIVTYNDYESLNNNLSSIFDSNLSNNNLTVNIINNHSNFRLHNNFKKRVNVIHNMTRPDWSTGHLSRNWNEAIINGFVDINNANCHIVAHCQDDTIFDKTWAQIITEACHKYSFISYGIGDNFCSYTVDSIRAIGLWDERFCNIGYQEADYFLRALIYNKSGSSINDFFHGRVLNPINDKICIHPPVVSNEFSFNASERHLKSLVHHGVSREIFLHKWGCNPENWTQQLIDNPPPISNIKNFIYYPFFEKNISNLIDKNYLVPNV